MTMLYELYWAWAYGMNVTAHVSFEVAADVGWIECW